LWNERKRKCVVLQLPFIANGQHKRNKLTAARLIVPGVPRSYQGHDVMHDINERFFVILLDCKTAVVVS